MRKYARNDGIKLVLLNRLKVMTVHDIVNDGLQLVHYKSCQKYYLSGICLLKFEHQYI